MSKNKRPSWYRFRARAEYDALKKAYSEVQARVLPPEEAERYDVALPPSWRNQPVSWILHKLGKKPTLPPGSGAGFVQSPFSDIYTRVYGVAPIADMKKYRTMVRNQPDIQAGIEKQVGMAFGKGFEIYHPKLEIKEYLTKFADEINLNIQMIVLGYDALVYGNAYGEILWDRKEQKTEQVYEADNCYYSESDLVRFEINASEVEPARIRKSGSDRSVDFIAQTISKNQESEDVLGIKPLDPLYVRVRRDSWGNIYGYLQNMSFPPVLLDTDSIIHIKYRPKSWGFESAYGTSVLMPLIKNNDLLNQFEADAAVWIHSRAVPPLIVKGGPPERPYSTTQMKDLMKALQGRTAASMIAVKGDVDLIEMQGVARALNVDWWLDYLLTRRYQAIGVPRVLMGVPEGTNRATAGVVFQEFITHLQLLQQFMGDAIETQVFYPLIKAKFGEDVEKARIVWPPIVEEDWNMRSQRCIQALQAGAISVNELRMKMGFKRLDDKMYNDVRGTPTTGAYVPKGIPKKLPTFAKPPSEGIKKKEDKKGLTPEQEFRVKKLRLLINQEQFKSKLLELVERAKFELKQSDKLVKSVKEEILEKAERIINQYVTDSYLFGKLDVGPGKVVKKEDLTIKREELPEVAKLKKKFLADFNKILEDMIEAREAGQL